MTSGVRPGRKHATALRGHAQVLPLLAAWTDLRACPAGRLGLPGRAGGADHADQELRRGATDDQRTVNLLHAATRAPAERGDARLETTFKALRRVSLHSWSIGAITAVALVLLDQQHGHTT